MYSPLFINWCFHKMLGYPKEEAAHEVLRTVRHWLEDLKKHNKVMHTAAVNICNSVLHQAWLRYYMGI